MRTQHDATSRPTLQELKARVLKPVDSWWIVFVTDPISLRLLWGLVRFAPRVTPNQVTAASLGVGLFAAAAFAIGWPLTGAVAYEVSFVLDCVDGKLARWHRWTSRRGEYWDGLVNTLVAGLALVGLTWHHVGDRRVVVAALLLASAWTLHMYIAPYIAKRPGGGHPLLAGAGASWLARHRLLPPLTFPDKHALLFFLAPIANLVLPVMVALALLDSLTCLLKARIAWRDTGPRSLGQQPPTEHAAARGMVLKRDPGGDGD